MTKRLKTFCITLAILLCGVRFAYPQIQVDTIAWKHFLEVGQQSSARTHDEKKLDGVLYAILRVTEEPDTSELKKRSLDLILKLIKELRTDDSGRIIVNIECYGWSSLDISISEIRSLDFKIVEEPESFPIFVCRVYPQELRKLISIAGIKNIERSRSGIHKN
jgi:hypothetical protein